MSVWPAWEVQESDGATSWFQVRLGFADGARVDALAVLSAGCLSIEDVRAHPALSLADLTVLADWIEGPLAEACGIEIREEGAPDRWPDGGASYDGAPYDGASYGDPRYGDPPCVGSASGGGDGGAGAGGGSRAGAEGHPAGPPDLHDPAEVDDLGGLADRAGLPDGPAPRRARPSWPRGVEGCWLAAEEYRAAQEDGLDPVLAVMWATGHSRRRSLKLIAQARDAGFLTPRHARR